MSTSEKLIAVLTAIGLFVLLGLKNVWGKIFYPIVWVTSYKWAGKPYERENGYEFPEELRGKWFKWLLFLHFGRSNSCGASWYQQDYLHIDCETAGYFKRLWASYMWSAWRNPMYNINYLYMSNMSKVVWAEKSFGPEVWDRKLRVRHGHDGYQLVWYKTEKKQNRFLWSMAKEYFGKFTVNAYLGWNASTEGRYTVALNIKLV